MMEDIKTTKDYIVDWEMERHDAWIEACELREKLRFNGNPNLNIQKLERQIRERDAYVEHCDDMIAELEP